MAHALGRCFLKDCTDLRMCTARARRRNITCMGGWRGSFLVGRNLMRSSHRQANGLPAEPQAFALPDLMAVPNDLDPWASRNFSALVCPPLSLAGFPCTALIFTVSRTTVVPQGNHARVWELPKVSFKTLQVLKQPTAFNSKRS